MFNRSFEEMGIPPGYGIKQLLFSPVATVLVVQARSSGKNWRPERLYFRQIDSDKYSPVGQPTELISQDFPFVHPSKSLLAYNCLQHRFSVNATGEERHTGDWDSLNICDLTTGTDVKSLDRKTLILPNGVVRGWISKIVAFSDLGPFVQAGLSKEGSNRMDYVVVEVDLPHRVLKPIVALPATFI